MDFEREVRNVRVSKVEMQSVRNLIMWINETLETKIREMSDLSTGAIYCQLMHSLWRRSICLSKVNFNTNDQWQQLSNYKLLKKSFQRMDLVKEIPERQLQQGRGHYDFANWFYKLYLVNKSDEPYNAANARKGAIIGKGVKKPPLNILDRSHSLLVRPSKNFVDEAIRSRSLINVGPVIAVPVKPKPILKAIQPRRVLREGRKLYYDDSRCIALNQTDGDEDHEVKTLIKKERTSIKDKKTENAKILKNIPHLMANCESIKQILSDDSEDPLTTMLKISSIVFDANSDYDKDEVSENWKKIRSIMAKASESYGKAVIEIDKIFSGSKSGKKTHES
ncbi:hypothetical protein ACLKA7_003710 [Drosophila subpalustris]